VWSPSAMAGQPCACAGRRANVVPEPLADRRAEPVEHVCCSPATCACTTTRRCTRRARRPTGRAAVRARRRHPRLRYAARTGSRPARVARGPARRRWWNAVASWWSGAATSIDEVREVLAEVEPTSSTSAPTCPRYARRRQAALERLGDELGVGSPRTRRHRGRRARTRSPRLARPLPGVHALLAPVGRPPPPRPVPAPDAVPTADRDSRPGPSRPARTSSRGGVPGGRARRGDAGRERLDAWFAAASTTTRTARRPRRRRTSPAVAHLHLGTCRSDEIAARIDRRRRGHEAFLRSCAGATSTTSCSRPAPTCPAGPAPQGDRWRDDDDAVAAWKEGRTGYPVVDAGMRQLRREGWMHNRARMLTASFLTKHLHVDWRVGAWHFMDWLVDGDLANNFGQWQWVAGTGTDSRPNRMFNPVTQSRALRPRRRLHPPLRPRARATSTTRCAPRPVGGRRGSCSATADYPPRSSTTRRRASGS
jgi:deoxyribodipyrimidine photo-lyase